MFVSESGWKYSITRASTAWTQFRNFHHFARAPRPACNHSRLHFRGWLRGCKNQFITEAGSMCSTSLTRTAREKLLPEVHFRGWIAIETPHILLSANTACRRSFACKESVRALDRLPNEHHLHFAIELHCHFWRPPRHHNFRMLDRICRPSCDHLCLAPVSSV